MRLTDRAVEPETRHFWMAGAKTFDFRAGAGNLGSGSTDIACVENQVLSTSRWFLVFNGTNRSGAGAENY